MTRQRSSRYCRTKSAFMIACDAHLSVGQLRAPPESRQLRPPMKWKQATQYDRLTLIWNRGNCHCLESRQLRQRCFPTILNSHIRLTLIGIAATAAPPTCSIMDASCLGGQERAWKAKGRSPAPCTQAIRCNPQSTMHLLKASAGATERRHCRARAAFAAGAVVAISMSVSIQWRRIDGRWHIARSISGSAP